MDMSKLYEVRVKLIKDVEAIKEKIKTSLDKNDYPQFFLAKDELILTLGAKSSFDSALKAVEEEEK